MEHGRMRPATGQGGDGEAVGQALLLNRLEVALAGARREAANVGVLAIALDDHPLIETALGGEALELTLGEVCRRLAGALRPGDTVVRLGAERFGAVCAGVADARDLLAVAERLQQAANRPVELPERQLCPTVSVGMTLAVGDVEPTAAAADASAALTQARRSGPARCHLFDAALRGRLLERLEIEHGLRLALERDELRLHYQPQLDTASERIVGMEALLRWEHPRRGLLSPGQFIEVAERAGLIVPLGSWVLEQACRQAAAWTSRGWDLRMAVNVSSVQLEQLDFVDSVAAALDASGLSADRLCLEVTETALLGRAETALTVLSAVRSLGVRVAVDDFGVGFSTLRQLRDLLPVHQLKVDRSFVQQVVDDRSSRAIVAAIVLLANSLGLEAVAEGVESRGQLRELRALGCGLSQGFLFAAPQTPEAIDALLERPTAAAR